MIINGKKIIKDGMKGLFSPIGLTVLSCLLILLLGVNPLILVFDLIIKSMSILSGNALIHSIINQTFTPTSPIFIIYIIIFVLSFLIMFFKIIKNSLSGLTNSKEFSNSISEQGGRGFSAKNIKWILIWLVSFFIMPIVFGIILYIIQLIASLFGLPSAFINTITTFSEDDWNNSLKEIQTLLLNTQTDLNDFVNFIFPKDINNAILPEQFKNLGISDEGWRNFLIELQKNNDAIIFKNSLLTTQLQINNILVLPIFKTTGNAAINLTTEQTAKMITALIDNTNDLSKFFNNTTNVPYDKLQIALATVVNNLESNNVNDPLKNNAHLLIQSSKWIQITLDDRFININETIAKSKFNGIQIYGLNSQKIGNVNNYIKLDNLTVQIASALYQQPIYSIFLPNKTVWITQVDWYEILQTIIATFGFTFCFTTFWSLILVLLDKLFSYFALLIVSPFSTNSRINDNGDKFQKWFKTIFSKVFVIFIVLFCVSLFAIIIWFSNNLFSLSNPQSWYKNDTNQIWYGLLSQFIIVVIVIVSSSVLLEFIGWSANLFNYDLRKQKWNNNTNINKVLNNNSLDNKNLVNNSNSFKKQTINSFNNFSRRDKK